MRPAGLSPADILGEVAQKQRGRRPLEADMQFVDFAAANVNGNT